MDSAVTGSPGLLARLRRSNLSNPAVIIWIAVLGLLIVAGIVSSGFVDAAHLLNVVRQSSGLGIVGIGQTVVIITGGIDLSNGSAITLIDVIAATILNGSDELLIPVILLCLGLGMFIGLVNGLIVTKLKVPPLITTLGMAIILRGISYVYTGGAPKGSVPPSLKFVGSGFVGPIPTQVIFWVVIAVLAYLVLRRTPFGRYIYAVGGNTEASRLSGVRTDRIIILAYVVSGLSAAIAGLVLAGYIGTGSLSLGDGYDLNSVAAAVIGGTAFSGGVGSIIGTAGGALFLSMTFSLLRFLGLPYSNQLMVQGAILIVAIYAYARSQR
jgi:ribose/xylose/arabinose/galactoside ABC-type transport system permease subunit